MRKNTARKATELTINNMKSMLGCGSVENRTIKGIATIMFAIGIQENHKLISVMYAPKNDEERITRRNTNTAAIVNSIIVIASSILSIHTILSFI